MPVLTESTAFRIYRLVPGLAVGLVCLALLLAPASARAWTEKGHDIINRLAAEAMPPETPKFFRQAVERLAYLGPEPDRLRNWGSWMPQGWKTDVTILTQEADPDHFIDMEYAAGFPLPRGGRYDYVRALEEHGVVKGAVKLETPGFLPYKIAEMAQALHREWAIWRVAPSKTPQDRERKRQIEESIIHIAGTLGHYVGDGSNPHHTTWHYNGWVEAREPNPEGFTTDHQFHLRFENDFVNAAVGIEDVRPLVAPLHPVADFFDDTLTYLRASNALVRDLYRLDKRNAFRIAPENAAANAEGKRFTAERLAAGAAMLRDTWAAAMQPEKAN
jgi:hypothetical protein